LLIFLIWIAQQKKKGRQHKNGKKEESEEVSLWYFD
jgi:hypothetical protein